MGPAGVVTPSAASLWVLVGVGKTGVGRGRPVLLPIPGRGSMGIFA